MDERERDPNSARSRYAGYNAHSSSRPQGQPPFPQQYNDWQPPPPLPKKRKDGDHETLRGVLVALLIILIFVALIIGVIWLCGGFSGDGKKDPEPAPDPTPAVVSDGSVSVHFIDVGQADCILIECADGAIMIDAGDNDDSQKIAAYLNDHGVRRLNYVIGTHAHADHMGGMDDVILQYRVDELIVPTKSSDTKFYKDVLNAAASKNVPVRTAAEGEKLSFPSGSVEIVDDGMDSGDDMNNNSYVMKFTYGETVFLFTGDAGTAYEREMLAKGEDLDADVLKVGHHGSRTSSCAEFLAEVTPEYAVIQVGRNNSYGHPSSQTLDRLKRVGAEVYRNDELGDIVVTTDGKSISITYDKEDTER